MPSRKHVRPPPRFCFVTPEFETKETSWFKKHSDARRSHAAYWGGSARQQYQGAKQTLGGREENATSNANIDKDASACESELDVGRFAAPVKQYRRSTGPASIQALPQRIRSEFLWHIESTNLPYLPSVPSEPRGTGSPSAASFLTFEFYGESFVKQFVMFAHDDYSIMFSGCLLLSYAHYMALTGRGTNTVLLELKGQVIRRISAKMRSSNGLLSPRCLTAILALGAPIVCLVSRDLPQRLSIGEYIKVSMEEDYLCCPQSANTAQSSLGERIVHRQAMRRLFFKSNATFKDADSLALLQYISNYINMYASFEPLAF
jgi:hypothetical protein